MSISKHNTITRAEERVFYQLPLLVVASFVTLELCWAGFSTKYAGWPLVLSLVLVGMPHGAVDFLVNSRLRSASSPKDQMLTFAGYCTVLLMSLVALLIAPSLTLGFFVVASAVHFGMADARDVEKRSSGRTKTLVTRAAGLARGTFILALPFAVSPAASWQVFADVLAIVGGSVTADPSPLVQRTAVVACGLAGAAQLFATTWRVRRGNTNAAVGEVVETVTIAAAFLVLHPLFAMGLYVIAWHSWRHMQPLSRFFAAKRSSHGYDEIARSIAKLHMYSLPLLTPTLLVFGVVGWWRLDAWTSEAMAALTITIFVVVTLPHHLLVEELVQHLASHEDTTEPAPRPTENYRIPKIEIAPLPVVKFTLKEEQTWVSHSS